MRTIEIEVIGRGKHRQSLTSEIPASGRPSGRLCLSRPGPASGAKRSTSKSPCTLRMRIRRLQPLQVISATGRGRRFCHLLRQDSALFAGESPGKSSRRAGAVLECGSRRPDSSQQKVKSKGLGKALRQTGRDRNETDERSLGRRGN